MFWNLVRYEFKNVNKWYLALYGAVIILSALIGVQTQSLIKLPELSRAWSIKASSSFMASS